MAGHVWSGTDLVYSTRDKDYDGMEEGKSWKGSYFDIPKLDVRCLCIILLYLWTIEARVCKQHREKRVSRLNMRSHNKSQVLRRTLTSLYLLWTIQEGVCGLAL